MTSAWELHMQSQAACQLAANPPGCGASVNAGRGQAYRGLLHGRSQVSLRVDAHLVIAGALHTSTPSGTCSAESRKQAEAQQSLQWLSADEDCS